jgi:hypothetical protein
MNESSSPVPEFLRFKTDAKTNILAEDLKDEVPVVVHLHISWTAIRYENPRESREPLPQLPNEDFSQVSEWDPVRLIREPFFVSV